MKKNSIFEKAIWKLINKWKKIYGLSHDIVFAKDETKDDMPFSISVGFPYSNAKICYSDDAVETWKNKEMLTSIPCSMAEYYVAHEEAHILVAEMAVIMGRLATKDEIVNAEEIVVDRITLIFLKLLYGNT